MGFPNMKLNLYFLKPKIKQNVFSHSLFSFRQKRVFADHVLYTFFAFVVVVQLSLFSPRDNFIPPIPNHFTVEDQCQNIWSGRVKKSVSLDACQI